MEPLDFTYSFEIKLSTRYGSEATSDEKPLAALDDYVSDALTMPEISQDESSITSFCKGASLIFCLMICSIFLETTWKDWSLLSLALSFRLFLKSEIFLPIIYEPPDSYLILSNEWKFSYDSTFTSAEFAERLVGATKTRD
jgi:hypothetical protein